MKKMSIVLVGLLVCFSSLAVQAQEIYMKMTTYTPTVATAGLGQTDATAQDNGTTVKLNDYIKLSSVQYDFEQTLNIGSQSTGAGAGKVVFNPLVITKIVDQTSAPLFQAMASGTPYQFIEFLFVSNTGAKGGGQVLYKVLLKLAAVKTISVSSVNCSTGCPGIAESVSFEYGGYIVSTYTQKPTGEVVAGTVSGWNRVRNVADNDPKAIIK